MEILIVSRTRFGQQRCIGGISLNDNRSVRLVQRDGSYWPASCPFKIGSVWDFDLEECASLRPPFIENVIAIRWAHLREVESIRQFLLSRQGQLEEIFWKGAVKDLYEGKVSLQATNGRAFIQVGNEPSVSTGFWLPEKDLRLQEDQKHYQFITVSNLYGFEIHEIQEIAYVGEDTPVPLVPAGTLCRVSLAASIKPHPDFEGPNRYYVQLSGCYL